MNCPRCKKLIDVNNAQRIVYNGKLVFACRDDRLCYKSDPAANSRHMRLVRRLAARYVI